ETFTLTATVTSGDTTNASSTGVATITDDDMSPISITIPAQNSTDAQGVILDVSSSFYDTDALTYSAIGLPTGLTIDSTTGVISGTIDNSASQGGVNGTYTVTVIATDGVNPATSQSFAWSVTNPAPTALDDGVIEITEDTATVITVLNNDSDPDGDTLSVISVTQPSNGVVSLVNGIITYTPSANYNGADSFTYTISDGEGGVDTATVTLNVTPVIDTFTDADELVSCNEDATLNGNVLENLVDTNGLSLNVVSFSVGSQVGTLGEALTIANVGSIEINSDGSYTFIPLANYNGSVPVINYTVSNGESTDDSSLSITVVPQNDAPTLLGATARVSEEGLTQGLQDDEGANIGDDTTNATVTTGTLSFADIDGDSLTAAIAAPTETFTSGGETIVWSGSGTATLTGSVNGNTVITVEITDQQTGTYKVNLLAPIDHPVNSVEDTLTLGFDVTVSDGVDTSNATLNVVVEDDMAFAGDIVKSVEIPQQNTNLLFMIDTSGSMGWDAQTGSSYITTVERMELLLTSMREVIESYAQMGSVRIQITTFNSGDSTHQDHWFTVSEALAFIGDGTAGSRDSSLNPSGGTNYDEALAEAQTAYAIDGKLEASAGAEIANVAYFLSDGQPQTAGGIESSYGITGTEITAWTNFLVANDISSYAVGFGSGLDSSDQAYLDPIAYDGLNETERDGVIVADSSTLADTLLSTVQPPLVGNVLGELGLDGFGADGGYFETIVIDGVTYTYDIVNNQITNSLNADIISGAILTLTTSNQGGLELNFDTGVYEYQPDGTLAQGESRVEFIEFTAVDGDGDTSTGTATLNISRAAKEIPVLSADIATVDESAMSTGSDSTNIVTPAISNVATGNIFANDTIPSGTSLSAITIDGAISSVDAGGVITVTTQEGNTLVVDKSTGDYTYTLINALEHYEKTEIANSAINDSDTFSTIYGGNSVTREYDYGIGHAGHTVTVQMNIDVYNYRWEEGSDEVTVTLNGQNSVSQTLSDDGTILLNVVLDEFGKFVLDIDNNANNSNESLTINNFSVVGNDNIIIIGAPLDTLVDSFTYSVTDRDGDVYSSTLDVTINDDVPSVNDEAAVSVSLVEAPVTNILLTLDVSGSMSTTVGGVSRLDIAKAALIDTIQAYENQGAANVNLTLFASSAVNVSNGWMSSTAAINYISGLYLDSNDNIRYDNGDGNLTNDTIVGIDGQMTNYEDAVAVTASNYNLSLPDADKYVAYLISDGAPTRENIEGSDVSGNVGQDSESGWIDTPYLNSWNSFINSNNIALEVIGIGTNLDETYLDMLQVIDGKTSTIVADETKLSEVMLSSVQSVQGSLYGNDSSAGILFGADGGNILEITYEGTTYSYDEANPVQSIVLSQGEMELDFETGNFTYTPTTTTSSDIVEDFIVSVTDSDGDTTLDKPLQLTISTDGAYAYDGSAIDGEGGYDTVTFSADTINFDNINNIVNVEALDLTVGDKTVSISLDDVLNITDANEHKLTIEGDSGDTLNVDTSGWTQDSVVDNGETTTYEYSKGSDSISLTVDDQIDTTGM
ncbi:MAG: tandem-95 repeat protein, partial [Campylobacterales bacterium]|nr:tandem-95 repeat protein [Campylobacterales bacterium]